MAFRNEMPYNSRQTGNCLNNCILVEEESVIFPYSLK